MSKRKFGLWAEQIARKYLEEHSYQILGWNVQVGHGEIDIITKKGDEIIFVEVKSLSSESVLAITETVSKQKKLNLVQSCQGWLAKHGLQDSNWRIDFFGVVYESVMDNYRIEHIPGAIY